jgi:hypothetical protein
LERAGTDDCAGTDQQRADGSGQATDVEQQCDADEARETTEAEQHEADQETSDHGGVTADRVREAEEADGEPVERGRGSEGMLSFRR